MPYERDITVRRLDGEAEMTWLYEIRAAVLRPDRPAAESHYAGDDSPTTIHLGAFQQGRCIGIASLYQEEGLRLRGMAVAPAWRECGVGATLLNYTQQLAAQMGLPLWCNARGSAVGFYAKLGWQIEGEGFDVPGIGPHHRMRWVSDKPSGLLEESSNALLCKGRGQRRGD